MIKSIHRLRRKVTPAPRANAIVLKIKWTLNEIKSQIYKAQEDGKTKAELLVLRIHKAAISTMEIPRRTIPKKSVRDLEFDKKSITCARPGDEENLGYFAQELAFARQIDQDAHDRTNKPMNPSPVGVLLDIDKRSTFRRVIQFHMARIWVERDALASALESLICQFIPKDFDHTVVQRCWGSIDILYKVTILL
jgi:hypothetical protein